MISSGEEEEQVRRAIVSTAVSNFDTLTESQEVNRRIASAATSAHLDAQRLKDQLVKLRVSSQTLARAGRLWARERKVVNGAMSNYQRITALIESPTLVEECVMNGMYHEAIVVVEHVLSYATPDDPFFASLGGALWNTVTTSLETIVLPRLAGPLTVDAAFKLTTFASRLGLPEAVLKSIFLDQRRIYLDQLRRDAESAGAPYACLLRHLSIYKVHVCEVVLQYTSCFDDRAAPMRAADLTPLNLWTGEQARRFLRDCERLLVEVTNGSELAMVMEQCSTCCATAATAHVDLRSPLSALVTERIKALFTQHMATAAQMFHASMVTFTLSEPTSQFSAVSTGTNATTSTPAGMRPVPVQLTCWLPLSYALNGALSAFNAVRKCVVPGVDLHCASEIVSFVRLTAQAVGRDTDLLSSMEASERRVLEALARAYANDFYGYLQQCVEVLLGDKIASWVRAATTDSIAHLDKLIGVPQPQREVLHHDVVPASSAVSQSTAAQAFVHVQALLPRAKTPEQKAKRLALFKQLDKDGSGALTFNEVYNGFVNVLHLNKYTTRLRDISRRAFEKAKSMGTKDRGAGDEDLVEFLEFRLMLCYLYDYFELSALFELADTSGDRVLDRDEFVQLAPEMRKWGLPLDNPQEAFHTIDENGSGQVTFDEFVSWAVAAKMEREGDPDAEQGGAATLPQQTTSANYLPHRGAPHEHLPASAPYASAAAPAPCPAPGQPLHNPFAARTHNPFMGPSQ